MRRSNTLLLSAALIAAGLAVAISGASATEPYPTLGSGHPGDGPPNIPVGRIDANRFPRVIPFFANIGTNFLCNPVSGANECTPYSTDNDATIDMVVGDLDHDGVADAVAVNQGGPNRVCLGNGDGTHTCSDLSPDVEFFTGVALGDLNRDGNSDLVITGSLITDRRCLGDGAGGFACADVSAAAEPSGGAG